MRKTFIINKQLPTPKPDQDDTYYSVWIEQRENGSYHLVVGNCFGANSIPISEADFLSLEEMISLWRGYQ